MCHECQAINQTISHYRGIEKLTTDTGTLDSIHILIARLEDDKEAFHPECRPVSRTREQDARTLTSPDAPSAGGWRPG